MSEHEWVVRIAKDGRVIAECIKIDCDAQLDPYDIDNNLNEHAALKRENETLERSNERAWDSARFFAGRNELLRLHIRCHLGLAQMECIGWSDESYRDALLKEPE